VNLLALAVSSSPGAGHLLMCATPTPIGSLPAQTTLAGPGPRFRAASVSPTTWCRTSFTNFRGRLTITNFSLTMLMQYAFAIKNFQISGGPGWVTTRPLRYRRDTAFKVH